MSFLRKLLNKILGRGSGFTTVKTPDGGTMVIDDQTMAYMNSKAPSPTQESLDAVLADTAAVRIHRGGISRGKLIEKEVLFESDDTEIVTALSRKLRIEDVPAGHCLCPGDPTIELLSNKSKRLAFIGVHHGRSIRWESWRDDALLNDGRSLLEWLAERGIDYPLKELEEATERQRVGRENWERWLAAMPRCLVPLSGRMRDTPGFVGFQPASGTEHSESPKPAAPGPVTAPELLAVLEEAYPDLNERLLAVFEWFGNGAGPWNGYPSYESEAEKILLRVPLDDLLAALQSADLSESQTEGAARLFACWKFQTKRKDDAGRLPKHLKGVLLEHSLKTENEDKRARAKHAY